MDMRTTIMDVAQATAQAHGYNGLSFRELAKAVGIKSASVHYHFPTKADLGVALARRYRGKAAADLQEIGNAYADPADCLRRYTDLFRLALANGNRMCMCGFMAAEHDDLPEAVQAEVQAFGDINISWLKEILARQSVDGDPAALERQALAIFTAVGGAQLAARSRGDIAMFDAAVEGYRAAGLIPA
jgi:TetR/AcrR family transcriptional repressor of nem operon